MKYILWITLCFVLSSCTSLQIDINQDHCNFNRNAISSNISFKIGESNINIPVSCIKI